MSYDAARAGLAKYRSRQISALMGESGGAWFAETWDGVADMLQALSSDKENAAVITKYATAAGPSRAADHLRLAYVCGLRREVRKQYVSGDADVATDVTPFRHGVMSAHGAGIFDGVMDDVVRHAERQADGGVA